MASASLPLPIPPAPDHSTATPLHDATRSVLRQFDQVITAAADTQSQDGLVEVLQDNLTRFRLWAGNIGAYHTDKRSLDARVHNAADIAERIRELLGEIQEAHEDLVAIVSGQREDGSQLHSGDGDLHMVSEQASEALELCRLVSGTISSLLKMSGLLRRATGRDPYARAASAGYPPYIPDFDIMHVENKFYDKLGRDNWLSHRLGKANVQRRQFIRYARGRRDAFGEDPADVSLPMRVSPDQVKLDVPGFDQTRGRSLFANTKASTLQVDQIAAFEPSNFAVQDLDNTQSQATSVATSKADDQRKGDLDVVKLEAVGEKHEPFECPYCFTIVQTARQRSWRNHVFRDIRAWTCTFQDCTAGLFESEDEWFNHEMQHHRRQWVCYQCVGLAFSSPAEMRSHLGSAHPEIADGPLDLLIDAASRPISEAFASDCPLCDWDTVLRPQASDQGIDNEKLLVPLSRFRSHLGHHLKQIALFVLLPSSHDFGRLASRDDVPTAINLDDLSQWATQIAVETTGNNATDSDAEATSPHALARQWQNVPQGLSGPYQDIINEYWQNLDTKEHDTKLHQLPLARIKKVMKADPEDENENDASDLGEAIALHKAAEHGHISDLKRVLNRADPVKKLQLLAATDSVKQTALHIAALNQQGDAVDILCQAGADPNLKDRNGNTVWDIADYHGDDAIRTILEEHKKREAEEHTDEGTIGYRNSLLAELNLTTYPVQQLSWNLKQAIVVGDVRSAASCIENGDDVGPPALHIAALLDELDIAKLLVERGGANVNGQCTCNSSKPGRSVYGVTPMHLAIGAQHPRMIEYLASKGAHFGRQAAAVGQRFSAPPLWLLNERWLAQPGNKSLTQLEEVLQVMLNCGWDPEARLNEDGLTMRGLALKNLGSRPSLQKTILQFLSKDPSCAHDGCHNDVIFGRTCEQHCCIGPYSVKDIQEILCYRPSAMAVRVDGDDMPRWLSRCASHACGVSLMQPSVYCDNGNEDRSFCAEHRCAVQNCERPRQTQPPGSWPDPKVDLLQVCREHAQKLDDVPNQHRHTNKRPGRAKSWYDNVGQVADTTEDQGWTSNKATDKARPAYGNIVGKTFEDFMK